MKKGKIKLSSFLFVVCLLLTAIVTAFIVVNRGTGGFMTRAEYPTQCAQLKKYGKIVCNGNSKCYWTSGNSKSFCLNKKGPGSKCSMVSDSGKSIDNMCMTGYFCNSGVCVPKAQRCSQVGDSCCRDSSRLGYCLGLKCNLNNKCEKETAAKAETTTIDYGQGNGKCARTFSGATCGDAATCKGAARSGYCPGPATWKCCIPSN